MTRPTPSDPGDVRRAPSSCRLAVSIGCPCGIGPEVAAAGALAVQRRGGPRVLLVGDLGVVRRGARAMGLDPTAFVRVARAADAFARPAPAGRVAVLDDAHRPLVASERRAGEPGRAAGAAQLAWIDRATDLVRAGEADALVTGPVSKEAIARSGARGAATFLGHTEHLAARLGAPEVTMAFWTEALTSSLVTTHLPLSQVPRAVTARSVARAIFWTAWLVARLSSARPPPRPPSRSRGDAAASLTVAVASLNPHAGEKGLLGDEESTRLEPGIARARERIAAAGLEVAVAGPIPAESAFRLGASGRFAAVVAMYHDQATIPMKLLGFGEAVNVSLGLPIVRTSVDHGTAYDRAGKGSADPRGMLEALRLAARLSGGAG